MVTAPVTGETDEGVTVEPGAGELTGAVTGTTGRQIAGTGAMTGAAMEIGAVTDATVETGAGTIVGAATETTGREVTGTGAIAG